MPPQLRRAALSTVAAVLPLAGAGFALPLMPSYTMEERAAAIASPSVVFIEVRTEGFLRLKENGALLHERPITVTARCSGFVAGANGHVITRTRCVQPSAEGLRSSASYTLANTLIKEKQLAPEQKDAYIAGLVTTTEFTAPDGATMDTKIYGQLFQAWGGVTTAPASLGQIVQSRPANAGDVSLIKFAHEDMPVAEVGGAALAIDLPVAVIGFGTADSALDNATYTVRSRGAKIIEQLNAKTPALYRMDGDVGPVSQGGMVVDAGGRVVGMIGVDSSAKDKPNRAVSDTSAIKDVLAAAGVTNALSSRDQAYRAGLDAYFAGRYSEAVRRLDTVAAQAPSHSVAQTYRRYAAERLAVEGEPDDGLPLWATILITSIASTLITLAGVVAVVVYLRRRAAAGQMTYYNLPIPISAAPISGAPVSGSGYESRTHDNRWAPAGPAEDEKPQ